MKEKQIVKCFCARESAAPASDEAKLVSEVTSKAGWQREKTRGYEVKHRRRILAHKCCRGSNTPGMVKS